MSSRTLGPVAACLSVRVRSPERCITRRLRKAVLPLAAIASHAAPAQTTLPAVQVTGAHARDVDLGLDDTTTTGSRLGLTIRETPAGVSIVTRDQIEERGIVRLQDAAVRAPGVSSAIGGGNGNTAMTARGFSGLNSVAQSIDGTRLAVASGTIAFPVSPWPYESVEVLRGPASVLFGDGAIGGAVNYITRQPRRDRIASEATLTVGNDATVRTGVTSGGPVAADTAYRVSLYGERSDGDIDRTRNALWGWAGSVIHDVTSRLHLQVSADQSRNVAPRYRGTPVRDNRLDPALRRANFDVADPALLFDDRWLRAKATWAVNDAMTVTDTLYRIESQRHFRDVQNYNLVPAATAVSRTRYVEIFHHQTQVGNRTDMTVDGALGAMKNKAVVGIDWYGTTFTHVNNAEADGTTFGGASMVPLAGFDPGLFAVNPRATVPRARTRLSTIAAFAEDALDITPHVKLVAGLRHDHMALKATDLVTQASVENVYHPLTGRLGAVWAAGRSVSLYAQVSTATDPANGLLGSTAVTRETQLAKARQAEVGAKGDIASIDGRWSAAAYRIEKRKLLAVEPVSGATQQVGRQSSEGIELAVAFAPARGWTLDANTAVLRARFDDFRERVGSASVSRAGNRPPNVPVRLANLWADYRFAPGWRAGAGLQYVGPRTGDNANATRAPGYTLIDATATWQLQRDLGLDLALRNIADRAVAIALANNGAQWLLGAPRTVELTARYAF